MRRYVFTPSSSDGNLVVFRTDGGLKAVANVLNSRNLYIRLGISGSFIAELPALNYVEIPVAPGAVEVSYLLESKEVEPNKLMVTVPAQQTVYLKVEQNLMPVLLPGMARTSMNISTQEEFEAISRATPLSKNEYMH
jgi:hypothetical protein